MTSPTSVDVVVLRDIGVPRGDRIGVESTPPGLEKFITGVTSVEDGEVVKRKSSSLLLVLTSKYLFARMSFIERIVSSLYTPVTSTLDKLVYDCMIAAAGGTSDEVTPALLGATFLVLKVLAMLLFLRIAQILITLLSSAAKKKPNLLLDVMQMMVDDDSCGYAGPHSNAIPLPDDTVAVVLPMFGLQDTQNKPIGRGVVSSPLLPDCSSDSVGDFASGTINGFSLQGSGRMKPMAR